MNILIKDVTEQTYSVDVLESSLPVIVDFWAPWCGPCKALAPSLQRIANEHDGKLNVAKFDVDQSAKSWEQFRIRGIPTLIVFRNGKEVARFTGGSQSNLKNALDAALLEHTDAPVVASFNGSCSRKADFVARLSAAIAEGKLDKSSSLTEGPIAFALPSVLTIGSSLLSYANELGLPRGFGYLLDSLYERLADDGSDKRFAIEWLDAMPVGVRLDGLFSAYAKWIVNDPEHGIDVWLEGLNELKPFRQMLAVLHKRSAQSSEWTVITNEIESRMKELQEKKLGQLIPAYSCLRLACKPFADFNAAALLDLAGNSIRCGVNKTLESWWSEDELGIFSDNQRLLQRKIDELGPVPTSEKETQTYHESANHIYRFQTRVFELANPDITERQKEYGLTFQQKILAGYATHASFLLGYLRSIESETSKETV